MVTIWNVFYYRIYKLKNEESEDVINLGERENWEKIV